MGGKKRGDPGILMALAWTCSRGGGGRGEQLIGSGYALASLPHTKMDIQRDQDPKYDGKRCSTKGGRRDTGDTEGPVAGEPPGAERDLGKFQGRKKGEGDKSRILRQNRHRHAARGAGRRYKRRRLEGDGYGKRPGGRRSTYGKEVGSGCDREVLRRQLLLMGGGSKEKEKIPRKQLRQVGRGDRINCNHYQQILRL